VAREEHPEDAAVSVLEDEVAPVVEAVDSREVVERREVEEVREEGSAVAVDKCLDFSPFVNSVAFGLYGSVAALGCYQDFHKNSIK